MKNDKLTSALKEFGFDKPQIEEIQDYVEKDICDFNVGDYRFIKVSEIDGILFDELESEPYKMGCFNPWVITRVTGISNELVKFIQDHDGQTLLGEHIINMDKVGEIADILVSNDSYGSHFAHCDNLDVEDFLDFGYYAFKIN